MSQERLQVLVENGDRIDDCWNRIGIHGSKTCPLLERHVHCRNCEVYAAAATRLLDRYALFQAPQDTAPVPRDDTVGRAMLLLRLGEEWLALATACLAQILPLQPVHSLPHQRSQALRGVVNVRGALVPCLCLAHLLQVEVQAGPATGPRAMPRMMILSAPGGMVAMPVDEIDGIHRLAATPVPDTRQVAPFTAALLQWRGRSVRLLDEQQLLAAVHRSLS